jgi:hypothetical protein
MVNRERLKLLADIYDYSQLLAAGQLFETDSLFVANILSFREVDCKIYLFCRVLHLCAWAG